MRLVTLLALCFFSLFVLLSVQVLAAEDATEQYKVGEEVAADEFDDDFDDFDDDFSEDEQPLISDPLEPLNRGLFWVNDKLYFYLFKPVARGYRVVPRGVRVSVGNFFSNIATPIRAVNTLLQFKIKDTGTELGRFVINTTVGFFGFFDAAEDQLGWEKKSEDFGQTLGFYGIGSGWYLVLPFFGPSSVRDGVGIYVDRFFDPLRYVEMKKWKYYSIKAYERINALSLDPDTYEGVKRDALDPYLFIRAAYAQHRLANIDK